MAKSSIYEAVQAAAEKAPGLERGEVFGGMRTPAVGGALTFVKCFGEWLHLGLAVDDRTGLVLTVDELPAEDAETLKEWLQPVVNAVGAKLLVTDDADASKTAADELGIDSQVCESHVKCNTDVLVDRLGEQAKVDQDGSLADIDVSPRASVGRPEAARRTHRQPPAGRRR
jgi:hypothetical protein